ncbi:cache domain-containing sensor histidine kinase [Paenibacillus silviterrae]|uniref:cache domain-containing sensor histidine kinase n=1 Tax=Paenibacillus silviterrae TaxID=3242194 RepID=UPI0025438885|nr:sensor histidine kinase [Paenibacillus chinjuensis]
MKQWMYRSTLNRRIWVSFTLLIVFCIAVTGLLSNYYASRAMEQRALGLSQDLLDKSVRVMDERLKQIIVASSTLMLSEAYKQTMRDVQTRSRERYFTNLSLMQGPFEQVQITEQSIDSILLSTPIGDFYPTTKIRKYQVPFQQTPLYRELKEDPRPQWIPGHQDSLFMDGSRVISLIMRPLSDYYMSDVYVITNVKEDRIQQLLHQDSSYESMSFMLLTKSGESVLSSAPQPRWFQEPKLQQRFAEQDTGHFEIDTSEGPMLINYAQSNFAEDWVLVGYQSKQELLKPMKRIQWFIWFSMAACIVIALFLARYLSYMLLKPLRTLQHVMKRVEQNDLSARFDSPFMDEIGEAGNQFNRMLGTIGELITEVREQEKEKRLAEVKALQAQIDPHFLYNTLNTVFWKCEMEEYDDVKEMVVSLSLLFRLGLNSGQEITTLGKEIEHVSQYLKLQQKCYEELFVYTIECDPELHDTPILKILLQPLVENSILHGLKEIRHQGLIRIVISKEKDSLIIRVLDNGRGMDADRVNRLTMDPAARQGYALSNVRTRLMLYYGARAGLAIRSEPNVETEIMLTIPMFMKEEER